MNDERRFDPLAPSRGNWFEMNLLVSALKSPKGDLGVETVSALE